MTIGQVRGKSKGMIVVAAMLVLLGLCFCPLNALPFRLILAKVDPRYVSGQVDSIRFDRDLWKARKYRVGMAQYLADNKLLDGKPRSELVEMLGEPDVDQPGDDGMRWWLGYNVKGLFDETLWLELTIEEKGTASGATVSVRW